MESKTMLLGYGAKNCWCFKDWFDVDLRLNGYVPKEISQNNDFSCLMAFEGANASGKTNGLKVLSFFVDFVKNSFSYSPKQEIYFDSFFSNKENTEFYIEFKIDDTEYRYEAILTKEKVLSETLLLIEKTEERIVFLRELNDIKTNLVFDDLDKIIFRDNASFISILHQYQVKSIAKIFSFFSLFTINVTYTGLRYEVVSDIPHISKIYFDNPKALDFTKSLIYKFDTGIDNIKISFRETEKSEKIYFPIFYHKVENDVKTLMIDQESTGTKLLFINLLFYFEVLENGGVLVLDEFDLNLHCDILPHLLKLFFNKETNPKLAQLIFTSHNSDIMDVLGKYRTYLFEKENGESFCYRLDEPKTNILRNDRSVSIPYKRHSLGGYPRIETS